MPPLMLMMLGWGGTLVGNCRGMMLAWGGAVHDAGLQWCFGLKMPCLMLMMLGRVVLWVVAAAADAHDARLGWCGRCGWW